MRVQAILDSKGDDVATISPQATLAQAVRRFRDQGIGALVVTDPKGAVLGLLAERDIVHGLADEGVGLLGSRVEQLMHAQPPTCGPDDDLKHIMSVMTLRRVRHLPVVAKGRLAGIISIGDVVKNRLDDMTLETNVLRDAYIASR